MNVYIKNIRGEPTVRDLPFLQALKLRMFCFARYTKKERPIVRFLV